jgi:glucose/arabinose dehydrogenase
MRARIALATALLLLALPAAASAVPQPVQVGTFSEPLHVAGPPGDGTRLFVVEGAGTVQVLVNGQKAATPFLDIRDRVRDAGYEEGLLSIAFAPDYAASGLFYVFYTDNDGNLAVAEGLRSAADPNRASFQRVVFTVPHPVEENHNGGQLAFGPDGMLYVGTGDGGNQGDPGNDAQRLDSLLGKILRLDPRTSSTPTIWSWGLRNPWRFSFDRQTGTMVIGDVGAGTYEEIDVVPAAGGNFGWRDCEGTSGNCSNPTFIAPALTLPHPDYLAVIGGFVVRDPGLPTLAGRYVFADIAEGQDRVRSVALGTETQSRREESLPVRNATSFGEDACGRIYYASSDGPVYRIQDGAATPCPSPSTPPPGGTPPPAADTRACGIKVSGHKRTQRILRRGKRLRLRLRSDEACTVILRAKRFRAKTVVLAANTTRTVRLKASKRGLRKLRRQLARSDKPRLRIRVTIGARDAAGNTGVQRVRPRVR